jgi:hypothetical protein
LKLDLDTEAILASLTRWRELLDQLVPSNENLHQILLEQRPVILKNYERTAAAWLMVLRTATPYPENQEEFDALILDIETFQNLASAELAARSTTAVPSLTPTAKPQGVDTLLASDPELAVRIAELKKRFTPPA